MTSTTMSKFEKEKVKMVQDRCQFYLQELLKDDDNKYCVDCDAKGPRWASWNLGIFLCIRCAGIHRNLGVHISKVKSVNLDSWTPEQVGSLQQMGNSKGRAVYEANLPDAFRRPQNEGQLETFIRQKYENKKFIAKEWTSPTTIVPAFDIEIELKKEKARKGKTLFKGNSDVNGINLAENNSVPRPHSNVTSSTTIVASKVPSSNSSSNLKSPSTITSPTSSSGNHDLLGLNFGPCDPTITPKSSVANNNDDDPFDAFVSSSGLMDSPITVGGTATPSGDLKGNNNFGDDESDFFNQKVTSSSPKKFDNESILKMFESVPVAQMMPTSNPMVGNNLFGPSVPQTQSPFNLNGPNGFVTSPPNHHQQQPFFPQNGNPMHHIHHPISSSGFAATNPFLVGSNGLNGVPPAGSGTSPSPFGSMSASVSVPNVNQLQQQMSSLSMNSNLLSNWMSTSNVMAPGPAMNSMAPTMTNTMTASTPATPLSSVFGSFGTGTSTMNQTSTQPQAMSSTSAFDSINPFMSTSSSVGPTPNPSPSFFSGSTSVIPSFPAPTKVNGESSVNDLFADFSSFETKTNGSTITNSTMNGGNDANWATAFDSIPTGSAASKATFPASDLWK